MEAAEKDMAREYITGWFSPADHELMVFFYGTDGETGLSFEADILKRGSVVRTVRGNSLLVLQSDIVTRYGGAVLNPAQLGEHERRQDLQERMRDFCVRRLEGWRRRE